MPEMGWGEREGRGEREEGRKKGEGVKKEGRGRGKREKEEGGKEKRRVGRERERRREERGKREFISFSHLGPQPAVWYPHSVTFQPPQVTDIHTSLRTPS